MLLNEIALLEHTGIYFLAKADELEASQNMRSKNLIYHPYLRPFTTAQILSYHIYEKIKFFAENHSIGNVVEPTFTDEIVYWMNTMPTDRVHIYKAKNEGTNGADIELVIKYKFQDKDEYIVYPLQAKIIKFSKSKKQNFQDGCYEGLLRKTEKDTRTQVQKIIDYASKITTNNKNEDKKGIPLHLLYNYSSNSSFILKWNRKAKGFSHFKLQKSSNLQLSNIQNYHWGCSIISSNTIKNVCDKYISRLKEKIVKEKLSPEDTKDKIEKGTENIDILFSELHNFSLPIYEHALPWFILFCPDLDWVTLKKIFNIQDDLADYSLSKDDVKNLNKGYFLIKGTGIFGDGTDKKQDNTNSTSTYQPLYRIIVDF